MRLAAKIRDARTTLSQRRTVRQAHKQLAQELATYVSPAERAELEELLDQHPAEQTRELRIILNQQDLARRTQTPALHGYLR
jgi:hypothetical protein